MISFRKNYYFKLFAASFLSFWSLQSVLGWNSFATAPHPNQPDTTSSTSYSPQQIDQRDSQQNNLIETLNSAPSTAPQPDQHTLPYIEGDLNHDGQVNLFDMRVFKIVFGTDYAFADFNHDGTINLSDFNVMKTRLGEAYDDVDPHTENPNEQPDEVEDFYRDIVTPEVLNVNDALSMMPAFEIISLPDDLYTDVAFEAEERYENGELRFTFVYFPLEVGETERKVRSIHYHRSGDRVYFYESGRFQRRYFASTGQTHYSTDESVNGDNLGRTTRVVHPNGSEDRYSYYASGQTKATEHFENGLKVSRTDYHENGIRKSFVDFERGYFITYYESGNRKYMYVPESQEFMVFRDEDFFGYGQGRISLHLRADGTVVRHRDYWNDTNRSTVREEWKDGQLFIVNHFAQDGRLLFREVPPERRAEGLERDENGMVILPSSDEILNFTYGFHEDLLRDASIRQSLWTSAVKTRIHNDSQIADLDSAPEELVALIRNFVINNPDQAIGSYVSFFQFKSDGEENSGDDLIAQAGLWPYDAIPQSHVPLPFRSAWSVDLNSGSVNIFDNENPNLAAIQKFLEDYLVALGTGKLVDYLTSLVEQGLLDPSVIGNMTDADDRPKMDILHLDNVGYTWLMARNSSTVLQNVKRRLNQVGVLLEVNIGGYSLQDPEPYRIAHGNADPVNDIASFSNVVTFEELWRYSVRTTSQTEQMMRNLRALLDTGTGVGLISTIFSDISHSVRPKNIKSIEETTIDPNLTGNSINALLVTLDQAHHIFPSGGSLNGSIRLTDLGEGYEAWEGQYMPHPVPGRDDQVILYLPNHYVPKLNRGWYAGHFGVDSKPSFFNLQSSRRVNAALAMIAREEGDVIGVNYADYEDNWPGGGDPNHPDNWTTWPKQFGEPIGSYQMTSDENGNVLTLSRQFENGTIVIHAQEDYVETIFN